MDEKSPRKLSRRQMNKLAGGSQSAKRASVSGTVELSIGSAKRPQN